MAGRLTLDQLVEVRILCPQQDLLKEKALYPRISRAFSMSVFMVMVALPTFLPLSEAARKYGLDEARLRALIAKGTIRAAMMNNQVVISEDDAQAQAKPLRKEDLPEYKKHAHLKGVPIWISAAGRKYNLLAPTILKWVRLGVIKRIGNEGNKVLLDEADVAYCAEIYRKFGKQGRRMFDENGLPYKPKTGPLAL